MEFTTTCDVSNVDGTNKLWMKLEVTDGNLVDNQDLGNFNCGAAHQPAAVSYLS